MTGPPARAASRREGLILILVGILLAGLLAAKFIFHIHFGHLLHAGH